MDKIFEESKWEDLTALANEEVGESSATDDDIVKTVGLVCKENINSRKLEAVLKSENENSRLNIEALMRWYEIHINGKQLFYLDHMEKFLAAAQVVTLGGLSLLFIRNLDEIDEGNYLLQFFVMFTIFICTSTYRYYFANLVNKFTSKIEVARLIVSLIERLNDHGVKNDG